MTTFSSEKKVTTERHSNRWLYVITLTWRYNSTTGGCMSWHNCDVTTTQLQVVSCPSTNVTSQSQYNRWWYAALELIRDVTTKQSVRSPSTKSFICTSWLTKACSDDETHIETRVYTYTLLTTQRHTCVRHKERSDGRQTARVHHRCKARARA